MELSEGGNYPERWGTPVGDLGTGERVDWVRSKCQQEVSNRAQNFYPATYDSRNDPRRALAQLEAREVAKARLRYLARLDELNDRGRRLAAILGR